MINPHNVVDILANLISDRLNLVETPQSTDKDEEVAEVLFDNVKSILTSTSYYYENDDTLDFDGDDRSPFEDIDTETSNNIDDYDSGDDDNDHSNDEDNEYVPEKEQFSQNQFSIEYMQRVIEYYDEIDLKTSKRKHTFSSLQQRFKRVKYKNYIPRFRMYIEKQGTKRQKLDEIDCFVYQSFDNARKQYLSIHDIDLKRWALGKASELGDISFVASVNWIRSLKKRHGIVSRKITKLTTKKDLDDRDVISRSIDDFLNYSNSIISNYSASRVLNTDQSGLQLEIYSNRTLSYQGEKITTALVRSINNTTHSYTIQPMISMSGTVVGPLFLCLKEESGRLSDRIKRTLFKADNIILTCSKSGKLNRSLVEYWKEQVLERIMDTDRYLLLSDSWGTQNVDEIYDDLSNLKRLQIPKKTTSTLQPLDVYFNRQYKVIVRKIYDYVRVCNCDIHLAQRNSIIKMNSLVYNQLSAQAFERMIQYAWFRSGYMKNSPGKFDNVNAICFSFRDRSCDIDDCDESSFIRCSWCQKVLCFNHFFIEYHIH